MERQTLIESLQQVLQLQRGGQLEEAARLCEKLLKEPAAAPEALQLLGLIRKQQGDLDQAERLLRASADLAPKRAEFQNNLGNLLTQLGRFDEAEFVYRAALDIDKTFRPARLALGRLYNRRSDFVAAEAVARELINHNASDAAAYVVLGTALRAQNRMDDAETALRAAIEIQPDNAVALHNLGTVLADRYRAREALDTYNAASRAGINGPDFEANRARALLAVDRIDDALMTLEIAVDRYPTAADPQALLAKLRHMQGEQDFARSLREALQTHDNQTLLLSTYAQLLRGAGRAQEAIGEIDNALQRQGRLPELLLELATARQEQGEFAAALAAASEAATVQPDNLRASDRVVEALLSLGRADQAQPLVALARAREPLNQWHIACEATVARLAGSARYEYLYDYDRLIGVYELPVPEGWSTVDEFNRDFAQLLNERDCFRVAPLDQSLRHGTQTPVSLLGDESQIVRAYLNAILEPIETYRRHIGTDPQHPLTARNHGVTTLAGAWSVHLRAGGYHVNHVHPEGWISSAYYVTVPPEVSDDSARHGWIKFGEPRYPVPGAVPARYVQPAAGRLVLFPSYLWHGTVPITGDAPRVTAPFDVVTRPA